MAVPSGGSFIGLTGRASYFVSAIGLRYATFEKVVEVAAGMPGKDGGGLPISPADDAKTGASGAGGEYSDDMGYKDPKDSLGLANFGVYSLMPESVSHRTLYTG
ncbi:MAG: hypothetical protein IPO90_04155 [Flavobacteriales bacterium]|nr:hypothetical protein [Flavobacteriales bacterium]